VVGYFNGEIGEFEERRGVENIKVENGV